MNPTVLDDPDFAPAESDVLKAILPPIRAELADGERLVWLGRPGRRRSLPDGVLVGMFGVLAASLILLFGLLNESSVMPAVVTLGVVVFFARAARRGLRARSDRRCRGIAYALTDRRVILREPLAFGQVRVRSFRAQDLIRTSRIERADGSGMILLEGLGRQLDGTQAPIRLACLVGLERAREVEALIRSTLLAD